jgi:lipid-A-disaccharide synthase
VTAGGEGATVPPRDIFLIAGEESGDQLGMKLIQALRIADPQVRIRGVGGPGMESQELASLFPQTDIAVMGFLPVVARLPTLLRRIRETAEAVIAAPPDVLVLIDSPDFTHRVARRVRARLPHLPIVDYVSPTVWAWRPGRARAMRAYVDHVLALLPFEPEAYRRLGGPTCSYVGHPLIERLALLRPNAAEAEARATAPPTVLVLPGSRRAEIERLLPIFGETVERVAARQPADFVLPAVDHLRSRIEQIVASWPTKPRIVTGEADKFAAFRRARAALAASGTVTLELALAQVPMVVAYQVPKIEELIVRALATVQTIVLPNLILGEAAIPQHIQADCEPGHLAEALQRLIAETPERAGQVAALQRLDAAMRLPSGRSPSDVAAALILDSVRPK